MFDFVGTVPILFLIGIYMSEYQEKHNVSYP